MNQRCRSLFLSVLVLCLLVSVPALAARGNTRIAVLGDRTGGADQEIFAKVVDRIRALGPDAVLTVGYQIQGYTEDEQLLRKEWTGVRDLLGSLNVPVCYTPGNHDLSSPTAEKLYREMVGEPMRSETYGDVHISVLDASQLGESEPFSAEVLAWLRRDLEKHRKSPFKVIVFHKPTWWYLDDIATYPIHALCREFGVNAVLTGHYHTYAWREVDGVQYISMGSSGGAMSDAIAKDGHFYEFGWITAGTNGFRFTPLSLDGVLTADTVRHERVQNLYRIRTESVWAEPEGDGYMLHVKNFRREPTKVSLTVEPGKSGWQVSLPQSSITLEPSGELKLPLIAKLENPARRFPPPSFKMQYELYQGELLDVEGTLHLPRTATCVRASNPPALDGVLDEACWREAEPITVFADVNSEPASTEWTEFYLAWDSANLYFAALCRESEMSSLKAATTEHDGPAYRDDNVRLYLDVGADQGDLVCLVINPKGAIYDEKDAVGADDSLSEVKEWQPVFQAAAAQQLGGWTVEAKIPFDQLPAAMPKTGEAWGVNFVRVQTRLKALAIYNTPPDMHPRAFARLVFVAGEESF